MTGIVAGIPLAVAVAVDDEAGIVLGRHQVVEAHRALLHACRAHHLLAAIEQLYKGLVARVDVKHDVAVLVERAHAEIELGRVVDIVVDACDRSRVDGEPVHALGLEAHGHGVVQDVVGAGHLQARRGDGAPGAVDGIHDVEPDAALVDVLDGGVEVEGNRVGHLEHAALGCHSHLEGGGSLLVLLLPDGSHVEVDLGRVFAGSHELVALLLQATQVLLHVFLFLGLLLETLELGRRLLEHKVYGVVSLSDHAVGAGLVVIEVDHDAVALDERGVGDPVHTRVVGRTRLQAVPVLVVHGGAQDVEARRRARARHLHQQLVAAQALGLLEIKRRVVLVEHAEQQVVGQVLGVVAGKHRVDAAVEGEHRVLRGEAGHTRHHNAVDEGIVLVAAHHVVVVEVVECKHVVAPRLEVANGELALVVGAAYALKGHSGEGRVGQVALQAHYHTLHGLEVAGPQHDARHLQRVDAVARREGKAVVLEAVSLVIVADGITEVDGIGGVGQQRVVKVHGHSLAQALDGGLIFLGWRHHHLLLLVVEGYHLVEVDFHLVALEIDGTGFGIALGHCRRRVVARATLGRANAGTRPQEQSCGQGEKHICESSQSHRSSRKVTKKLKDKARRLCIFLAQPCCARRKMREGRCQGETTLTGLPAR